MNTNCSVKILIVDDDAVARKVLAKMLAKMGFASDIACNGQEALIELEKSLYHLVIMDIQIANHGWNHGNQNDSRGTAQETRNHNYLRLRSRYL